MQPVRIQGGGLRKKWCSHNCACKMWCRENKERSKAIKRRSANKPSCKKRKAKYGKIYAPIYQARVAPEYKLWNRARTRSRQQQLSFTIQPKDIKIPFKCLLLGIPLFSTKKISGPSSPSLDRIDPREGYIPNNVWVISHLANTAKSNLSLMQLKKLVENLEAAIIERKISADF